MKLIRRMHLSEKFKSENEKYIAEQILKYDNSCVSVKVRKIYNDINQ